MHLQRTGTRVASALQTQRKKYSTPRVYKESCRRLPLSVVAPPPQLQSCRLITNCSLCAYLSLLLQVCEDRAVSEEEVEEEVREILAEMGHSMFLPAVRIIALLLRPFVRSALHGIFVNREGLEKVYFSALTFLSAYAIT